MTEAIKDLLAKSTQSIDAAALLFYIKTGIFEVKFHRYIMDAFDLRNAGDYGSINAVTSEKAQQTIREARELHDLIKSCLEQALRVDVK